MKATPSSKRNAVRRSNARATHTGSAAMGIQNSGRAVKREEDPLAMTTEPTARKSQGPPGGGGARTRFCPNWRR